MDLAIQVVKGAVGKRLTYGVLTKRKTKKQLAIYLFRKRSFAKGKTMIEVKWIKSTSEIKQGEQYVLVQYGDTKLDSHHSRGHTLTIESRGKPDDLKRVEFLTAVEGAKRLAKAEFIDTVYVIDYADSE